MGIDLQKKFRYIDELNGFITRTATKGEHLRQLGMASSKTDIMQTEGERMQPLQEHVEECYLIIQRLAVIITDILLHGGSEKK